MQPESVAWVDQYAKTTTILAGAFASSVVLYMFIAWYVAPSAALAAGDDQLHRLLAIVLAVVSAGHLVAAQVLTQVFLRMAHRRATPAERLGGYRTGVIIGLALREGVALYGLVLSLLDGNPKWAIGFGVVALFSMIVGWPRRSVMEGLAADVPPIG